VHHADGPGEQDLQPKVRRTRRACAPTSALPSARRFSITSQSQRGVLTSDAGRTTAGAPAAASCRWGCARRSACRCGAATTSSERSTSTPRPRPTVGPERRRQQVHRGHLKLMIAIGHQAALAWKTPATIPPWSRRAARGHRANHRHALASHQNILQGIRGGSYLIQMD